MREEFGDALFRRYRKISNFMYQYKWLVFAGILFFAVILSVTVQCALRPEEYGDGCSLCDLPPHHPYAIYCCSNQPESDSDYDFDFNNNTGDSIK